MKPAPVTENKVNQRKVQKKKRSSFVSPIESSDILREYAKENLVYSETLKRMDNTFRN